MQADVKGLCLFVSMTKYLLFALCFLSFAPAWAQQEVDDVYEKWLNNPKWYAYSVDGEVVGVYTFEPQWQMTRFPTAAEQRRGQHRMEKYSRMQYNVHYVYPYAVKVAALLEEVHRELNNLPNDKARREYVKSKEKYLFGRYEQNIRNMTRSQGKILVQLVYREAGTTMYSIIRDLKSGATALFWQSIGSLFGINLKTMYDGESDEYYMVEVIVRDLEAGGYNIAYQAYNYRLP